MYKQNGYSKSDLHINTSLEGETIEMKVERVTQNNEPIKDGAPLIYTDRKDGVQAGYNIKTDRFEIAVEAMDKITKTKIAQREQRAEMKIVRDGGTESTEGNGTDK